MGLDDKLSNSAENLGGKAKEAAGSVVGNEQLEAEGKGNQLKSKAKDAVEDVKDKASEAFNKLKGE